MSRFARSGLLGLTLVAGSCRLTSDDGITGVFTPGAAARIQLTTTQVAGGHAMIRTERVDSARAIMQVDSCAQSVVGGTCDLMVDQRTIALSQAQVDALFRQVSSPEFRAVRASYQRTGDIVPPDPSYWRLDVTVSERSRTISWGDTVIPRALEHLRCLMSAAAGSLILCSVAP